jgi:hypothetical protein
MENIIIRDISSQGGDHGMFFREKLPSYKQLKKLRTALAISRGIGFFSVMQQEVETTVSHDQAKRVTYLTDLFTRIHREFFCDWKEQATVTHLPGIIFHASKRKEFRETVERLVLDGDGNQETVIFGNNGFAIRTENMAERLALFYSQMRALLI